MGGCKVVENEEGWSDSGGGGSIGNNYKQDTIVAEENRSWSESGTYAENRITRASWNTKQSAWCLKLDERILI